jgi:hypothetical protein
MSTANAGQQQPEPQPLDLSEKGLKHGKQIALDRRLFMKFTAFGACPDPPKQSTGSPRTACGARSISMRTTPRASA